MPSPASLPMSATIARALARPDRALAPSSSGLPAWFDVSGLAAAAIDAVGREVARLTNADDDAVATDRRLAGLWFGWSIRPIGWTMPSAWDPIAGDYATADGWIRLHTNAPHHRRAALRTLGVAEERAAVAEAVRGWTADALEAAVVAEGGCAAAMRDLAAWADHPQGAAVAREPLIGWSEPLPTGDAPGTRDGDRPLAGLKVLDMTRVLAGPTATRALAGFGADVLRLDPPDWDEPGVVPEVTAGKRCAGLDLSSVDGRATFGALLAEADVFVHGLRPGALDRLGFGADTRRRLAPRLIETTLNAYGWTGPWAGRRGFDSLVQMSAGIAARGMAMQRADRPVPLPVQALDHATGWLMAAAALRAIGVRDAGGPALSARLSLARVAALLADHPLATKPDAFTAETAEDLAPEIERTAWGDARRLRQALSIGATTPRFDRPATALRSAAPRFEA